MTRPGSDVSLHKIQSKARGNVLKISGMILEIKPPETQGAVYFISLLLFFLICRLRFKLKQTNK